MDAKDKVLEYFSLHSLFGKKYLAERVLIMSSMFDLTGKKAIVTGASSGLGANFARALAQQGADVAIAARRKDRLTDLAQELKELGVDALPVQCDVKNEEDVIAMVKEVKDHFGRIDILINNAGVGFNQKAEDQTLDQWHSVIDVNLSAVFLVAREVGKVMIEQKYGKIVNLGSLHSNTAISADVGQVSAYAASKGGVQMLTKSLAAEWARYNITVNALGPAYFPSEMTEAAVATDAFNQFVAMRCPTGRVGKPEELNGAMIYFASDASSYTTGQLLNIDGGWNCI